MSLVAVDHLDVSVVIVGDGPAGLALGRELSELGVSCSVIGSRRDWTATYGTWVHPGSGIAPTLLASASSIDAVGSRRHHLELQYGVFDNAALRSHLLFGVDLLVDVVTDALPFTWGSRVVMASGRSIDAKVVVDATGSVPVLLQRRHDRVQPAAQTAFGVVVAARPDSLDGEGAVLMDWRQPMGESADPTFLYALPVGGGRWLVEETALARRPPQPSSVLEQRLRARLGDDVLDAALHVEHVHIPMHTGVPSRSQPTIGFGAAAGYVHPATGYSVTSSLRAASRVADVIALSLDMPDARRRSLRVWNSVWPTEMRRVRALHDYGLAALLRLGADAPMFFDAFFDLPAEQWYPYLQIDCSVGDVTSVMAAVFRRLPATTRRRLAAGNPVAFARLVR